MNSFSSSSQNMLIGGNYKQRVIQSRQYWKIVERETPPKSTRLCFLSDELITSLKGIDSNIPGV